MDQREGHNFMACGQAHGPDLVFQGVGQGADPLSAMDPREENNLITCGQAYGPDLVSQGVGQGVDPLNAMDGNEGNTLRVRNFGGGPELAHERSTVHAHSGYNANVVDLGTGDDANTSEFEYMSIHGSGQGPPGGHLVDHNVNHESHASHLNTNDADLNTPVFVSVMEVETSVQEKKIRPSWRKLYERVLASVQVPPPGPFDRTDLKWEAKSNQGNGNIKDTHKATIHWARLDDFLEGEMSTRQFPCTFHEESRQCMKGQDRKQVRAESAIQEIR